MLCILDFIDPEYGIGRLPPDPYGAELTAFLDLLRRGQYGRAYAALSNVHYLAEIEFGDAEETDLSRSLSSLDRGTIIAIHNASQVLTMPAQTFQQTLAMPFFLTVSGALLAFG